jgi:Ca-activated chloride channel family protein
MINSFTYDYPAPTGEHPIAAYTEIAPAPWQPQHRLIRIGIKGREADLPPRPTDGTLELTVARDVDVQIEFNPAVVSAYRLIGNENTEFRKADVNNALSNSGNLSSGQTVTALFEVIPRNMETAGSRQILDLRIRYTEVSGPPGKSLDSTLVDQETTFASATEDFRFASAVASFGMILQNSPYKGNASLDMTIDIAEKSRGTDRNGERDEFIRLVRQARLLQ